MDNQFPGLKFHHVALMSKDFDKTTEFYSKALGAKRAVTWNGGGSLVSFLQLNNGDCIELFSSDDPCKANGGFCKHLCFETTDIEESVRLCLEAGAKLHIPVTHAVMTDVDNDEIEWENYYAFVIAPDGEYLEFNTYIRR